MICLHDNFICLLIFGHALCGILVPPPGIEPVAPALGVQSLSHWTTREIPLSPSPDGPLSLSFHLSWHLSLSLCLSVSLLPFLSFLFLTLHYSGSGSLSLGLFCLPVFHPSGCLSVSLLHLSPLPHISGRLSSISLLILPGVSPPAWLFLQASLISACPSEKGCVSLNSN